MGRGRDKRRKREDASKTQQRIDRTEVKQRRGKVKRQRKQQSTIGGLNNEEDATITVARLVRRNAKLKRTEEIILDSPPPSPPRSNATLVPHPTRKDEILLFGGELWNGERTTPFNDLFLIHVTKNRWRQLIAPGGPAPRSSCQALSFAAGNFVVFHGGEFVSPSQSQYVHFRDTYRLDLDDGAWTRMHGRDGFESNFRASMMRGGSLEDIPVCFRTPDSDAVMHSRSASSGLVAPSARSGHRLAPWRRHVVLFGGFYDNALETHYYNDLWVLTALQGDGAWRKLRLETEDAPHPRSGCAFAVINDCAFVYGGYFTHRAARYQRAEATVFHDLWSIALHTPQPVWKRLRLLGIPPPIRAGVSATVRLDKIYLFGGVVDVDSLGNQTLSTFVNDLSVFHANTERFFPIVRPKSSEVSSPDVSVKLPMQGVWPSPRMNSSLCVRDHTLYLYGGQMEQGDREITFGDLYSLSLNAPHRGFTQHCTDPGSEWVVMERAQGDDDSSSWEDGSTVAEDVEDWVSQQALLNDDDDDDDDDEGQNRTEESSSEEDNDAIVIVRENIKETTQDESMKPKSILKQSEVSNPSVCPEVIPMEQIASRTRQSGKSGLRRHKEQLEEQLSSAHSVPAPLRDESLQLFIERTWLFWLSSAQDARANGDYPAEEMAEDMARALAQARHEEASALLKQLSQVEEQQREEREAIQTYLQSQRANNT